MIGDAGLLIDPSNAEDICGAMHTVLSDRVLADKLSVLGRARAEKWSWGNAAGCYLRAIDALG